ncbi:MAG: hypothetical protein ACTSUE_22875 [Promethearchaeota archaeon]
MAEEKGVAEATTENVSKTVQEIFHQVEPKPRMLMAGHFCVWVAYLVALIGFAGWSASRGEFKTSGKETVKVETGNSGNFVFFQEYALYSAYIRHNDTPAGLELLPHLDDYCWNWGNTDKYTSDEVDGVTYTGLTGKWKYKLYHEDGIALTDLADIALAGEAPFENYVADREYGELSVQCHISRVTDLYHNVYKINTNSVIYAFILVPFSLYTLSAATEAGYVRGYKNLLAGLTSEARLGHIDYNTHLTRLVVYPMASFISAYFVGHIGYWDHIVWAMAGLGLAALAFIYNILGAMRLNILKAEPQISAIFTDSRGKVQAAIAGVLDIGSMTTALYAIVFVTYTAVLVSFVAMTWGNRYHMYANPSDGGHEVRIPHDLKMFQDLFIAMLISDYVVYFFAYTLDVILGSFAGRSYRVLDAKSTPEEKRAAAEAAAGKGAITFLGGYWYYLFVDLYTAFFIFYMIWVLDSAFYDNHYDSGSGLNGHAIDMALDISA